MNRTTGETVLTIGKQNYLLTDDGVNLIGKLIYRLIINSIANKNE